MDRVKQKREARHVRSKQARHDRFISAYIRRKSKEVYEQAERFYHQLDKKYPNKRDLTITDEFVQETTNYASAAQAKVKPKKKSDSQGVRSITLEIPLMDKNDVEIVVMDQKADESLTIPDHIYQHLLTEISKDPTMSAIFNSIEQSEEQSEEQPELNQIIDESLLLEQEFENLMYQ